jgi:hypothetical protein
MDTNNSVWRTATNKKKDKVNNIVNAKVSDRATSSTGGDVAVNKNSLHLNNSFSSLDNKDVENKKSCVKPNTKLISPHCTMEIKEWGYDQEPEVGDVLSTVKRNIDKCENFEQRMGFLQESMAVIADTAASLIRDERGVVDDNNTTDRETVKGLHDLAQFGTAFSKSMSDNLIVINDAIDSIEKQKTDILDGWNKFVQNLNMCNHIDVPKNNTNDSSFLGALENGRHIISGNSTNNMTTSIGLIDVKCPTYSNAKNMPLMSIQYSASLSCFVINLDGDVYSFGSGKFTSRKGKCSTGESTLYGKRCNPREMNCSGASCTYYHDPLKFAKHAHSTRNMSIPYITEDLIKGIASDQEIVSNTSYDKNPFIVEDIVQLAGMLLLKAIAVKSIVANGSSRNKNRKQLKR